MKQAKIWKEWKYIGYWFVDIPCMYCIVWKVGKLWKIHSNYLETPIGSFKTKEQAMLKAQSLILKEYRKIKKVMRDKDV